MMKAFAKPTGNVKTLKAQLFAAIAMMLVAAISLGTATYAWFVNSSVGSIETMQFQATSADGIQISIAKGGFKTVSDFMVPYGLNASTQEGLVAYKSTITNADITSTTLGNYPDMFAKKFIPASIADGNLTTAVSNFFTAKADSVNASGLVEKFSKLNESDGAVKMIPLYFRSKDDMNVYFNASPETGHASLVNPYKTAFSAGQILDVKSGGTWILNDLETRLLDLDPVTYSGGDTYALTTGQEDVLNDAYELQAKQIAEALRIAVVPAATSSGVGSTNIKRIFQLSDASTVGGANNTYYHPAAGGPDTTAGKLYVSTIGTVDTVADRIATTGTQTALTAAVLASDYQAVGALGAGLSLDATDVTGKTPLFVLPGETDLLVYIYIWLEGVDESCINALADNYFAMNIDFIAYKLP